MRSQYQNPSIFSSQSQPIQLTTQLSRSPLNREQPPLQISLRKAGGPSWEEGVLGVSHFLGPPSVPDQAINVVLGPPLTGGDFKDVSSAEQQLLGVSICHHLPRRPGEEVYAWKGEKGPLCPPSVIMGYPGKGFPPCHTSQGEGMPNMPGSLFEWPHIRQCIMCYWVKGSHHIMFPGLRLGSCKGGPLS